MRTPLIATFVLLVLFIVAALFRGNYEFLFYATTLIVVIGLLYLFDREFHFSGLALWGFNLWLLIHLLGGMAHVDGTRLYDFILLPIVGEPYNILKYDQFAHIYCYIVIAMLVWEALAQIIPRDYKRAMFLVTVLTASGIGGMNEIIEFSAVVIIGSTGVGDYTNTALDLVANVLGAIIGTVYMALASGGSVAESSA